MSEIKQPEGIVVAVVRAQDLRPGDVLLVRAPQPRNKEHLDALVDYMRELGDATGCPVYYVHANMDVERMHESELPEGAFGVEGAAQIPVAEPTPTLPTDN